MQAAVESPKGRDRIISSDDANAALQEFSKLDPAQQGKAKELLAGAFQKNVFEIDDGSRAAFANAFGMKPQELSPQQAQKLGGMHAQTTIQDIATNALKKQKIFNPEQMNHIIDGAKNLLDKGGQAFVAADILGQSADGSAKMDPKARKPFVKWMAGLDQDKSVSDWKQVLETPRTQETSAFSRAMAGAQTFEQLIAAFMMFICGELQDKTTEKMKEADGAHQDQKVGDRSKEIRETAGKLASGTGIPSLSSVPPAMQADLISETANRLGLQPQTVASELSSLFAGGAAADATAPSTSSPSTSSPSTSSPSTSSPSTSAPDTASTTPASPGATSPAAGGGAPKGGFNAFVDQAKNALDSALNSTHAHLHDVEKGGKFDGLSGIISGAEAGKIAGKLFKLPAPAAELIATTMMGALLNSTLKLDGPVKPIADWAAKMLGGWNNVDLDKVMSGHPIQKVTGKLEHSVTDYIVGALEASAKTMGLTSESSAPDLKAGISLLKDKMSTLKSFQENIKQNPVAKRAWEMANKGPIDAKEATAAKAAEAAGGPPAATNAAATGAPPTPPPTANTNAAPAAGGDFGNVSEADTKAVSQKSTAMLFEELKQLQQELQQVMQALSNVLNMMKENAMNSIRSIR